MLEVMCEIITVAVRKKGKVGILIRDVLKPTPPLKLVDTVPRVVF